MLQNIMQYPIKTLLVHAGLSMLCASPISLAAESASTPQWTRIEFVSHPGPIWLGGGPVYVAANDIREGDGATTFRLLVPTLFPAASQSGTAGASAWKVRAVEYTVEFRCGSGREIAYHVANFIEYEGENGTGPAHELPQVMERGRDHIINFRDGKLLPSNAAVLRKFQPSFCPEPARPAPIPRAPDRTHRRK